MWRTLLVSSVLYALLRPVFGLVHELTLACIAFLLHLAVSSDWWQPLIRLARLDPVYAGAAVRAIGGVQVTGLAVAAPVGAWLHALAPQVLLAPELVSRGAGVSMIAAPGAPALGRDVTSFLADVVLLTVGLWMVRARARFGGAFALLGLFIQAQIAINHLLDAHVNLPDLNASGIPFALALAMPGNGWFTNTLSDLGEPLRTLVVGGTLVALAYACAGLVLLTLAGVRKLSRRLRRSGTPLRLDIMARRGGERRLALVGSAVALVAAVSPIGALAVGRPSWAAAPLPGGGFSVLPATVLTESVNTTGPSQVEMRHNSDGTWTYVVNGDPTVIRGVGYNPWYASLPADQRAQLYQRDFSAMHQLGINTIEGWFETQFDQVTLDAAARNGIGVLMPFELNQDWPYDNPNVQQSILDHVSAYVERYKDSPAVRMWAPGNENLHRILYPHWVSKEDDPTVRARADAFAAFLPKLVDRIHELDPNHPVIYRDAEDVYLPRLKAAFEATGMDRPWLVYGANVYSLARMQQIIQNWPQQWMAESPLVLSEFAPGGVGPAERGLGLEQDWAVIRSRPGIVLGGLAYTWATNGPEDLDRVFGFVNPQGVPTDGALAALSASYLADTATASAPPPG